MLSALFHQLDESSVLLVKLSELELSAGSEVFDLNQAHHQKSIKPEPPTQTKSAKPILEPKAT